MIDMCLNSLFSSKFEVFSFLFFASISSYVISTLIIHSPVNLTSGYPKIYLTYFFDLPPYQVLNPYVKILSLFLSIFFWSTIYLIGCLTVIENRDIKNVKVIVS